MRRTLAIAVLLVMVAGISAPVAWAAQVSGDTHACCRRGGAHHCTEKAASNGTRLQDQSATCPLQHSTKLVRDRSTSVVTRPTTLHALAAAPLKSLHASSAKALHDYQASVLTRGPPLS